MSPEEYCVQENTGNLEHPSVDDVVELALARAAGPRSEEHPDGHFDRYIHDTVEQVGEPAVEKCIRLTLVEGHSHRSAGFAAFGEENYLLGIDVGVAASAYLRELLGKRTVEG